MKFDHLGAMLIEALGVPGNDAEVLVALGFPRTDHLTDRGQGISDIDVFDKLALIDAQKRSATFTQILDRHAKHSVENQHRVDQHCVVTQRLSVGLIKIQRTERQGLGGKSGIVTSGDGASPMVFKNTTLRHILVAIALMHGLGTGAKILSLFTQGRLLLFCLTASAYPPNAVNSGVKSSS